MTQQEQFEADYLAAFPVAVASQPSLFEKDADGGYGNVKACAAFGVWLQQTKRHEEELRAKAEVRSDAEETQWRNIRKVVKALADFCFGSKDDPRYGSCHIAITTSLTAKDGIGLIELEPLYTAPPAQAVALPDASHYLIWFDDADRKPELFSDKGAALRRYEQISISWNAHLFVLTDSNCRDAGTKPAQAASTPDELVPAIRQYRHNNGDGLVFGYDIEETNKLVAELKAQAVSVPEGWKLVPVEATEEMLSAMFLTANISDEHGVDAHITNEEEIWSAIIAAAPELQK